MENSQIGQNEYFSGEANLGYIRLYYNDQNFTVPIALYLANTRQVQVKSSHFFGY